MTNTRAPWRIVFMNYPCPTCGAAVNESCRTSGGAVTHKVHVARTQHGDRCPRCASQLTAEDDPGAYCARCQLLRALEIERATYHVRRRQQ